MFTLIHGRTIAFNISIVSTHTHIHVCAVHLLATILLTRQLLTMNNVGVPYKMLYLYIKIHACIATTCMALVINNKHHKKKQKQLIV